jgi:hypothetical protein
LLAFKFPNSSIDQHPRLTKRLFHSPPMGLRNC